jgi:hypothetical protein
MDARTRWIIGVLVAVVIGLGVGLIIVAGDNSKEITATVPVQPVTPQTQATPGTTQSTLSAPINPSGGTSVPNPGTGTSPGSTGGL